MNDPAPKSPLPSGARLDFHALKTSPVNYTIMTWSGQGTNTATTNIFIIEKKDENYLQNENHDAHNCIHMLLNLMYTTLTCFVNYHWPSWQ